MIKVEIDRHILSELVQNFKEMDKCIYVIDKKYSKCKELQAKNQALIAHLVGEVEVDKQPIP